MNGGDRIDQNDRPFAHGLRLRRSVWKGARFIEQHQRVVRRGPERESCLAQHVLQVSGRHTDLDPRVQMLDGGERHVVRGLHQSELCRRLDEAAGADEVLSRHHIAPATDALLRWSVMK